MWYTSIGIVAFASAMVAWFAGLQLSRRIKQRRRAASIRQVVLKREPGPRSQCMCELAGTVDMNDTTVPAITVQIWQVGRFVPRPHPFKDFRGPVWHWTEERRSVTGRPFTLVLHGSGARVRVDPDECTQLHSLAHVVTGRRADGALGRMWYAQIRHGERVAIRGMLLRNSAAQGYREPNTPQAFLMLRVEGEQVRAMAAAGEFSNDERDPICRLRVVAESAAEEPDAFVARQIGNLEPVGWVIAGLCLAVLGFYAYEWSRSVTVMAEIVNIEYARSGKAARVEIVYAPPPSVAGASSPRCKEVDVASWVEEGRPAIGVHVIASLVPGAYFRGTLGRDLPISFAEFVALVLLGQAAAAWNLVLRAIGRDQRCWFDIEPLEHVEAATPVSGSRG